MEISDGLKGDLNTALNESDWLDIGVDSELRVARFLLRVLTLPEVGNAPADRRVVLRCDGVGRVAASLRGGRWDDDQAPVEKVSLDGLSEVVRSFGGQSIYGWEFIDPSDRSWGRWGKRLSLDAVIGASGGTHVIELFQESGTGPARHLDLRVWFDELSVTRAEGQPISLEEFAAGGTRWWDALYARDPRAHGHGIAPLSPESPTPEE